MAHLAKKGPWYVVRFNYLGREFKKSLKTKDADDAQAAMREVENRLHGLLRGHLKIPPSIDPGDYIVWGDMAATISRSKSRVPSLSELAKTYLDSQVGLKAESTLLTEGVHLRNLQACLGRSANAPLDQLRHRELASALHKRLAKVSRTTVRKERQTLVSFMAWAVQQQYLDASPAAHLPTIKGAEERPPFRTLVQIGEILKRGGLDAEEAEKLWECLYLTQEEIAEILELVSGQATQGFVHPMFAIAAYTGMRRGEMLRLRWLDVDFERCTVAARSRKQSRQRAETCRVISMHPELRSLLEAYRKSRPRGQYVIGFAGAAEPLTKDQANDHFRRSLTGSRWQAEMPSGKKKIVIGFHTFRQSFASNLAAEGVDQRIIDAWMGHQTEAMRRRYQHLFPQHLADGIQKLSYTSKKNDKPPEPDDGRAGKESARTPHEESKPT